MVINNFREWLQKKYLSALGKTIATEKASGATVVWLQREDDNGFASFYDVDIGVWTRVVAVQEPATTASRVNREVQEALVQLASLRFQTAVPKGEQDALGPWSLHLLFLVQATCEVAWRTSMQDLRAQSGFSEEIGVDVVFFDNASHFDESINRVGGLPYLLMATRQLFMLDVAEAPSWLSADEKITRMLKTFPAQFTDRATRALADELVLKALNDPELPEKINLPTSPKRFRSLSINQFRNIEALTLPISDDPEGVSCQVVFGPNGTGKSSIFEALSLTICGASKGLEDYLRDSDNRAPKAQRYVDEVLKPFIEPSAPGVRPGPESMVDGESGLTRLPDDFQDANRRRVESDGTFLSQEDARSFVTEDSKARGARVLAGYSAIAQIAQAYVAKQFEDANRQRQDWLRKFGLNASIKKSSTRLEKLCGHFLETEIPKTSSQLSNWLDAAAQLVVEEEGNAHHLDQALRVCDSDAARVKLAQSLAQLGEIGGDEEAVQLLIEWLSGRETTIASIRNLVFQLEHRIDSLTSDRDVLEKDLSSWRDWLAAQTTLSADVRGIVESDNDDKLKQLLDVQSKLEVSGREHRLQLDHLMEMQSGLLQRWMQIHPDTCPTCNVDHSEHGGISAVVARISSSLASLVAKERAQYAETQQAIKEKERARALNGRCPLSEERRKEIAERLGFGPERFSSLETILVQSDHFDKLSARIDVFVAPPRLPLQGDVTTTASLLWQRIVGENAKGQALWTLPDNWDAVKRSLNEKSMVIVQQHLPQTLEAVWLELATSLTAARWNLVGTPRMEAETRLGAESLKIVASNTRRSVAAKYFYNQAEQHTLGLAWFFARYFAFGRFRHSLIAMDDPAQEMDQTTFRTFTRFMQTIVRLHVKYRRPLSVLVFLHQEERALDMARATNHKLTAIKWGPYIRDSGEDPSIEQFVLLNPEYKARLPEELATSAP